MDSGNVFAQARYDLDRNDTIADALEFFDNYWEKNIGKIFTNIIEGKATEKVQNEKEATYCAQRISEDGLINWKWHADRIHNFVRAQTDPYPCAFTDYGNSRIRILKTLSVNERICCTPGQVIRRDSSGVVIGCGDNTAITILKAEIVDETDDIMSIFKSIKMRL